MIDELKEFDNIFKQNNFKGDLECNNTFRFIDKSSHTCLTAPHSTASFRKESLKPSDLYTGAICLYLSKTLAVSTIVRNKYSPQKDLINDFVFAKNLENHYFIDVHGMSEQRDFEVAIGIGEADDSDYKIELDFIKIISEKYHISTVLNHEDYTGRHGFTGKLQRISNKSSIMQIELRKDLRDFYSSPEIFVTKTLPFLNDLIYFVENNKIKLCKNNL